jgi:hypothetical protein
MRITVVGAAAIVVALLVIVYVLRQSRTAPPETAA